MAKRIFTFAVKTVLLRQVDYSKSIGYVGDHVLNTKVIPLRVSSSVKIWSKSQFVLELTTRKKLDVFLV